MPDTFFITIIFVVLCTVIGAFLKGRAKDACLKDFSGNTVFLEETDGKLIWGKLNTENTALEFVYSEAYLDEKDDHIETSYVLYKNEYSRIKMFVRYVADMTDAAALERKNTLSKI
ncbi:MAG: hypothetical protein KJ983_02785, partial [Candidatus Omnitrophica bacterium]|nr:hypothetical protein [Candidatus Omnitrophota bacterium]